MKRNVVKIIAIVILVTFIVTSVISVGFSVLQNW